MAAQSFELDMEEPKQTTTNGTVTTSSSPSSSSSNNEASNVSESVTTKKNASSLDASLLSPTSANATVRTRRNNNTSTTSGKSSVFQLVKSKATTSSLATSNIASNNDTTSHTNSTTSNSNVFDENNGFEVVDNHRDLEKTLPKIDLNRNLDLFGQSNSTASSSGVINRKDNVDDSPIAKPAMEGKTKFANSKLGRLIRRFINHIRVWTSSPIIKYSLIILLVLSLIALLVMFVVPMFNSSSVNVPPIIRNEGTPQEGKIASPEVQKQEAPSSGPSLWERITTVFSRSQGGDSTASQTVVPPAELVLTLSPEKYRENFENYLSQSKPIVLKKYSNKWISSSTWKKEFTSNKEFIRKLNKMKKQLSKYIKRKGVSITLVNMDKLPSSVYRVPFTPNLKEHEFEYDFPISLDQFSTLKTVNSEIWFANPKKDQLIRVGRKENSNKFTVCMIADTSQYSQLVQLSSPSGEDTETEIKTNDCIYIPSGWSFNFNVKASTKFVTWVYE